MRVYCVIFIACNKGKAESGEKSDKIVPVIREEDSLYRKLQQRIQRFSRRSLGPAIKNGIKPMETRDDTLLLKNKLVRLPDELELYKTYPLSHSIPF